jgi:hypothetical protein
MVASGSADYRSEREEISVFTERSSGLPSSAPALSAIPATGRDDPARCRIGEGPADADEELAERRAFGWGPDQCQADGRVDVADVDRPTAPWPRQLGQPEFVTTAG